MDLFKSKKGYTLVELLVSMAIFSILMIVFTRITFSALSISNDIAVRTKFREGVTEVMDLIKRDIRNGESIGTCDGQSCEITVTSKVLWEMCPPELSTTSQVTKSLCKFVIEADGSKRLVKRTPDEVYVNSINFETLNSISTTTGRLKNASVIFTIEAAPIKNAGDLQKAIDGELLYDVRQIIISTRNFQL